MQEPPTTDVAALDDAALMQLLQRQPRVGAAALYDRYGRVVFSVALRIVGDQGAAEEITQDVFVGCWRSAEHFRPERGSLLTWLLGITHHRAIDEVRSRRYKQRQREATWETMTIPDSTQDGAIDLRLLQEEVRVALADLPPAQREVIELLYYGGLTRQETADRLQAPLGTVHTRLRLGMAKLRRSLSHLLNDDVADTAAETEQRHAPSGGIA